MVDTVYLATPSYNGEIRIETSKSQLLASKEYQVIHDTQQWSALPFCFNQIWCQMLNLRTKYNIKYFVMLHADIGVEAGFVDTGVKLLEEHKLDVLSVVSPIKDDRGLTSTSILSIPSGQVVRRLVIKELDGLPEVFRYEDIEDGEENKRCLGVNTGCFFVRVNNWCEQVYFQFRDWIEFDKESQLFKPGFISEDWDVSRQFYRLGLQVGATRVITLDHYGVAKYSNQGSWGRLEKDDRS